VKVGNLTSLLVYPTVDIYFIHRFPGENLSTTEFACLRLLKSGRVSEYLQEDQIDTRVP
jgi:hypothetical protein